MKERTKDFYSRNNANDFMDKYEGSGKSYNSETGKTTVTYYKENRTDK
ncbi:hypothetical protein [Myroides marinus]|nr:hypothetical protein [Myroides marinus]